MKTFKDLQEQLAEDQYTADYKIKYYVDPITGENKTRKIRPHRVNFAASKMRGEPAQKDAQGDYGMKEGYVSANSAPDIQPQMNEGKMGQIHADIEDRLGKHVANYKKMGGSEHLGNKTTETAKHIAKLHGIAQHHAQKFVNDYVDNALKESDESWAAAMEKQKKDRLTDKDKGTLGKIHDLMAKEKAKREFDLKMKKAQNSQRVAKALGEETISEAHVVHVSDGSKYDEEPHEQDVKHVNDGVKKHGGEFDGHSDKGAFFKFKSHSDAENFRRHVNASPKRTVSADHLDESVNEAVDKEHPIYKEYQGLMKKSIKDLRNHIKQQHRIIDTSEFRTKEHAASHIINTKHGNKRVKAVFGEETELDEKYDHGPIDREAKVKVGHHAAVVAGSGVDSGKHGKVIGQSKTHIGDQWHIKTADGEVVKMYKNRVAKLKEESELNEAYRLPSDSEIDKVKAHVKANHPNKSLAQVAVHKQSKKIEYVVKDKDGKMTGHTLGEEVEQIDEISKKTLGSYVKKAAKDRGLAGMEVGALHAKSSLERMKKRLAGIEKATDKLAKEETDLDEEKRGLWANIHAKRERIKRGSGERMRKPGSKGAPTDAALKAAAEQVEESRGHKILATALGNIERWKNVSFDQPKYTEKGIETPKKDAESKEKKQMVSKEENEKVYDEKWKKYVGKSFKKATE